MKKIIKRIICWMIFLCPALTSLGQNAYSLRLDDLYSMALFAQDVLNKVENMPAKESINMLDSALDTLKSHRIGGLLPCLLYSTKIDKGIAMNDTAYVLSSLHDFRNYVYDSLSEEIRSSFNYGFGKINPLDNSWTGESYIGMHLYRQRALMVSCAYPETDASQYGIEAVIHTTGLRLFADNAYKYAGQASSDTEVAGLYRKITRLQQEYRKWGNITPMNAPTLQYDYSIMDYPERKALKDSIEENKAKYISLIYQDYRLLQDLFVSWVDIKHHLKDNEKAIAFAKIESEEKENSQYIAFVIDNTCNKPRVVQICNENRLIEWLDNGRLDMSVLYNIVWQPLKNEISSSLRIYFATDGLLHKLPLESAIKNSNVFRLSSIRLLSKEIAKSTLKSASLFGGLTYSLDGSHVESHSVDTMLNLRYGVESLPYTKAEVSEIAHILQQKGISTSTYIGENGTEENFRAISGKDINILHLATHGFFWTREQAEERSYVGFLSQQNNDDSMLRSGLLFSGANVSLSGQRLPDDVEDGVLTAQELANLDLGNINLVVMSACDTALGDVSGEGVFGLQRGFKLAGAESMLMSLWKVDDEATKVLMTEFYRYFLDGKSKAESLRMAQEYVKSQSGWENPMYWAGFILLDALD